MRTLSNLVEQGSFMNRFILRAALLASAATAILGACTTGMMSGSPLPFFVSSTGSGKGADLGGLAGADRLCTSLGTAANLGTHTWRAYLSTQTSGGTPAVNARDRIGTGPWANVKGVVIAKDVTELHAANNLTKQTALT
jgi:hypothetical protein